MRLLSLVCAICIAAFPVVGQAHHIIEDEVATARMCIRIEGQRDVLGAKLESCMARTSTPTIVPIKIPETDNGPSWLGAALLTVGSFALGAVAATAVIIASRND